MSKDIRYTYVKEALLMGKIASLKEIFTLIPLSVVGRDIHMSDTRLQKFVQDPASFTMHHLECIAELIKVDSKVLFLLVLDEIRIR